MIEALYKPFQKWSEVGTIWIYSDPHFGDKDCKYMDKNWITPEEHINIINKSVGKSNTLTCL